MPPKPGATKDGDGSPSKFYCTACKAPIKTNLDAKIHPLIDCLICRKCYNNYGDGDFENWDDGVDEEGDDNYCRWCCDGGNLFGCVSGTDTPNRCHYSFCEECIKRNVPDDLILRLDSLPQEEADNLKWVCYACDKSRLSKLQEEAQRAIKLLTARDLSLSAQPNGQGIKRPVEKNESTIKKPKKVPSKETETTSVKQTKSLKPCVVDTSVTVTRKLPSNDTSTSVQSVNPATATPTTSNNIKTPSSANQVTPKSTSVNTSKTPSGANSTPAAPTPVNNTKTSSGVNQATPKSTTVNTTKILPDTRLNEILSKLAKTPVVDAKTQAIVNTCKILSSFNSTPSTSTPSNNNKVSSSANQATPKSNTMNTGKIPSSASSTPVTSTPLNNLKTPSGSNQATPKSTPANTSKTSSGVISTPAAPTSVNNTKPSSGAINGTPVSAPLDNGKITSGENSTPATTTPVNTKKVISHDYLKRRIELYSRQSNTLSSDLNNKFQNLIKMFSLKDWNQKPLIRKMIESEIKELSDPIQEYEKMISDLKRLL